MSQWNLHDKIYTFVSTNCFSFHVSCSLKNIIGLDYKPMVASQREVVHARKQNHIGEVSKCIRKSKGKQFVNDCLQ